MLRITIKREGNLLPVVLDREVTEEQAKRIRKILEGSEFEVELATFPEGHDAPVGAGESVEAFRG